MAFVQIIDFHTSRFDEGRPHVEAYEKATEGRRTARRVVVGHDRDDPNHYVTIAFFDSYESAMENSSLPETQALAEQLAQLSDGPPTFYNLEVIIEQ